MINYFVSYAHEGGFGRCTVYAAEPINTAERLAEVESKIKSENGVSGVLIINFFPMEQANNMERKA